MKGKYIWTCLSLVLAVLFLAFPLVQAEVAPLRTIVCGSAQQIQEALQNAQPGDRILIKSGVYKGNIQTSGAPDSFFYAGKDGTAANPIIIESEDPAAPAILEGTTNEIGYVLYITGDYWMVKNLKIKTGRQGIMMDNSNNSLLYNCEVYDIGQEGIHVRDGSSKNRIEKCSVHDTGKKTPGFGEGIYIGSDFGKWNRYLSDCDDNIIVVCTIGPNVTGEHIDIKEGTTGTIIDGCIFNGTGITGEHFSDSFIDVKGNKTIVKNSTAYRNQNEKIVDAFQVHEQLDGWGKDNQFDQNTIHLDNRTSYIVNVASGSASAAGNKRVPEGNMYCGKVRTTDEIKSYLDVPALTSGQVLFKEDFEDGDYNGWEVLKGSWTIETDGSKVVKQSYISGDYFLAAGSPEWSNYSVEARIKPLFVPGTSVPVSLMIRFKDPMNFYYARLSSAGVLEIRKKQGSTKTLASKSLDIVSGTWYTVKLVAYENLFICYVNGKQELVAEDSTFKTGRIALNCYKSNGEFDDILVQEVKK